MNYWLTTHWPPLQSQGDGPPNGIFLPSDRGMAGADLKEGDKVLIYQSRTGRTVSKTDLNGNVEYDESQYGKEGIVAVVEALSQLYEFEEREVTHYTDGSKIKWSWEAETKTLSLNGFVSRVEVNQILGYSENYTLRGFGDLKSGLKKLTEDEFNKLLTVFKKNGKQNVSMVYPLLGVGESQSHFDLKNYVGLYPAKALSEEGLTYYAIEFPYPTTDRCDVIVKDKWGSFIVIEIELEQNIEHLEGMLQAIKYRYMFSSLMNISDQDVRAMLVAYKISPELKKRCKKYNVECIEIGREKVESDFNLHEAIQVALLNSFNQTSSQENITKFINDNDLYHNGKQITEVNVFLRTELSKGKYYPLFEMDDEYIRLR